MTDPGTAMIVVDMQRDFCPGGALAVTGGSDVVPIINALTPRFATVVFTQDWHPPGHVSFASAHIDRTPFEAIDLPYGRQVLWPDHCVIGTLGAEFHPDLDTHRAHMIVRKGFRSAVDSYSGFKEADRKTTTGLGGYLRERGITRVLVCGLATDYCVAWTALDARALGLEVAVVEDASRGIDTKSSLTAAWTEMTARGIGRISSTAI